MALYALKRFGAVLLILVVMSVLVFLATHALPANTAALILGQYSTPDTQAALELKLGLDLPLPVQYWHWASGILLRGDLGQSLIMERPIAPILWDAPGARSAILSIAAMVVVSTVWASRWASSRRLPARRLARPRGFDFRLRRHIGTGVLLGSRAHPGVRQHAPSAAHFRRGEFFPMVLARSSLIWCCR